MCVFIGMIRWSFVSGPGKPAVLSLEAYEGKDNHKKWCLMVYYGHDCFDKYLTPVDPCSPVKQPAMELMLRLVAWLTGPSARLCFTVETPKS